MPRVVTEGSAKMVEAMSLALAQIDASQTAVLLDEYVAYQAAGAPASQSEALRKIVAKTLLVAANGKALALFGLKGSELPVPVSRIWPFGEAETLALSLLAALRQNDTHRAELNLRHASGRELPVIYTSWREVNPSADIVSVGFVDVSERVATETALHRLRNDVAHADRISTMGVMTATIVHEIRQPIASILNLAHAALRWVGRPEPDLAAVKSSLEDIQSAGNSVRDIVTRLHGMSSAKSQLRARCSVNELVEETAAFLRAELSRRQVKLSVQLDSYLPLASLDRVQVQQVLVNLMMNAAQAMADAHCWSRTLLVRTRALDASIHVEVEDSGPGVPPETRERLFDGFFSTKPGGLGLGLRICRSIIEDHGGELVYVSKASAGSIFRFSLPTGS